MLLTPLGVFAGSLLAYLGPCTAAATTIGAELPLPSVCQEIASSVSSASSVYFPGTGQYSDDIHHYATSSTQEAACSFEPGTPEDVGIALQILGRTRTPFAVKGGGHALNPGFSSTSGVQIAMSRFSDVTHDSATQTANVGAGLVWDDVYAALEPYGVNVAGGRVSGIGVGGLALGGGYSWHAAQYGLTIDTVEAFQLVLPNGTVTQVDASQPDLFFGLKGGFNNFGIVTQFTFKTFPQTQVWGGTIIYGESEVDQLVKATASFAANNKDPKANVVVTFVYAQGGNVVSAGVNEAVLFYDAPSPPAGLFDDFLTVGSGVEVFTRSFLSLVQSSGAQLAGGSRMRFNTVSVLGYPEDFLQYMVDQSVYWATKLPLGLGYVSLSAEPLLPDAYNFNTSPTAWPGSRTFFIPFTMVYSWSGDGTTDDVIVNGMKENAANLQANAAMNQPLPLYPNTALADTPLEAMYGGNVERLSSIVREVDPENVMGLTGGFKF